MIARRWMKWTTFQILHENEQWMMEEERRIQEEEEEEERERRRKDMQAIEEEQRVEQERIRAYQGKNPKRFYCRLLVPKKYT